LPTWLCPFVFRNVKQLSAHFSNSLFRHLTQTARSLFPLLDCIIGHHAYLFGYKARQGWLLLIEPPEFLLFPQRRSVSQLWHLKGKQRHRRDRNYILFVPVYLHWGRLFRLSILSIRLFVFSLSEVTATCSSSFDTGISSTIAPCGQTSRQRLHWLHWLWSITAWSQLREIAPAGQIRAHSPHPIHRPFLTLSIMLPLIHYLGLSSGIAVFKYIPDLISKPAMVVSLGTIRMCQW